MKSIILTGGGTGGHVMPNLALLPELSKHFDNIYYIGGDGIEKDLVKPYKNVKYYSVTCVKLRRSLSLSNLLIPFKLLKGIRESKKLIKELEPDIIFSKGGFASVPVVLAAGKVPVVAHESDLTLGLANRIILAKCKAMCCSFDKTASKIKKGVYTGSPINEKILRQTQKAYTFDNNKKTILVTGGSMGAMKLNQFVWQNIDSLTSKYNVIHLVGKNKQNKDIKRQNYVQIEFSDQMGKIYNSCDIVISRAGSNTIFELLAICKPMLLIPLSKAQSRGDQIDNAKELAAKNLCLYIMEENLNMDTLDKKLTYISNNIDKIQNTMKKQHLANGNKNIVSEILKHC